MSGYGKLDHRHLDTWLFPHPKDNEQASDGYAFLYLLREGSKPARWGKISGCSVSLKANQFHVPLRELAKKWHWSVGKVQRFIQHLEKEGSLQVDRLSLNARRKANLYFIQNDHQPVMAVETTTDTPKYTRDTPNNAPNRQAFIMHNNQQSCGVETDLHDENTSQSAQHPLFQTDTTTDTPDWGQDDTPETQHLCGIEGVCDDSVDTPDNEQTGTPTGTLLRTKNKTYIGDKLFERVWAVWTLKQDKKRAGQIFCYLLSNQKDPETFTQMLIDDIRQRQNHRQRGFNQMKLRNYLDGEMWHDELLRVTARIEVAVKRQGFIDRHTDTSWADLLVNKMPEATVNQFV